MTEPQPAATQPAPLVTLTLGDSITAAGKWQAELVRLCALVGVTLDIRNVAVAGVRTTYWPPRINSLLAQHQPDLVTLFTGTNDDVNEVRFGEPATAWAWRAVVEAVHTFRPANPIRVLPALIQYSDPLLAPDWLLTSEPVTNDRIYGQWSRYPANWFAGIVDLQQVPATADYLDDGGIHPTDRGYRTYAALIYRAVQAQMGWPESVPQPCGMAGHRRGFGRPAYIPCPIP